MNKRGPRKSGLKRCETKSRLTKRFAICLGISGMSMLASGCVETNVCGVPMLRLTAKEYQSLGEESQKQYASQLRAGELNCGWKAGD